MQVPNIGDVLGIWGVPWKEILIGIGVFLALVMAGVMILHGLIGLYGWMRGLRYAKMPVVNWGKGLISVLVNVPKWSWRYWQNRSKQNPAKMPLYGLHIFVGRQGAGKTLSAARYVAMIKHQWPRTKVLANIEIDGLSSTKITNWAEVDPNRGEHETVVFLDEIHVWASSLQSTVIPPEVMAMAAQQRKRGMVIIGTAQVPTRVAKPLREQTYYWHVCRRMGPIHVVDVFDGEALQDDGTFKGSPKIRYAYVPEDEDYMRYATLEIVDTLDVRNYEIWTKEVAEQTNTDSLTVEPESKKG